MGKGEEDHVRSFRQSLRCERLKGQSNDVSKMRENGRNRRSGRLFRCDGGQCDARMLGQEADQLRARVPACAGDRDARDRHDVSLSISIQI